MALGDWSRGRWGGGGGGGRVSGGGRGSCFPNRSARGLSRYDSPRTPVQTTGPALYMSIDSAVY